MSVIRIGIIGVGGFAATHIRSALRCEERGLCRVEAAVARLPYNPDYGEEEREKELRARGVRIYRTYDEMFAAEKGRLDLVTVPLGINLHSPVSIAALKAGYHVLCEKPAAGNAQDAVKMLECAQQTGRLLAIGFQHVLTPGIQYLKSLSVSRTFGRLVRARTIVKWPRDSRYYGRNEWAGKLAVGGRKIYDSPMQNAAAHFLQNMLYISGGSADGTAFPDEVYGENYRANSIESADTQFVRIRTNSDVLVTFTGTHAVDIADQADPYAEFEFEAATIGWNYDGSMVVIRGSDELRKKLSSLKESIDGFEVHDLPFVEACRAIDAGRAPRCSIANSIQHIYSVESSFASSGGVHVIPADLATAVPAGEQGGATLTVVPGLSSIMDRCFDEYRGPAELGIGWGHAGTVVRPAER